MVCNWKHARTDRVKDHVKSVHRILTPTFQVHYRDSFEDGMYESMNFLRSWHRRNDKRSGLDSEGSALKPFLSSNPAKTENHGLNH